MNRLFEEVEITYNRNCRRAGWEIPISSSSWEEDSESKQEKHEEKRERCVKGRHIHGSDTEEVKGKVGLDTSAFPGYLCFIYRMINKEEDKVFYLIMFQF